MKLTEFIDFLNAHDLSECELSAMTTEGLLLDDPRRTEELEFVMDDCRCYAYRYRVIRYNPYPRENKINIQEVIRMQIEFKNNDGGYDGPVVFGNKIFDNPIPEEYIGKLKEAGWV